MSEGASGFVGVPRLLEVTLTLDTSAYADGDVLADTQPILRALRAENSVSKLDSLVLLDEDDQGVALDLVFFSANVSLGTENAAPSITDANARNQLGFVKIATTDYIDLGGCRIATKTNIDLPLKSAAGTTTLYVAAITRGGTPTYTASGIKLRLFVI
jgi:hypothetical protein